MKGKFALFLATAQFVFASAALAEENQSPADAASDNVAAREVFSTGVAKGRDRLDSATSTSSLKGDENRKFGSRSIADVLRTMAGLRVESGIGEGNNNYTVRGLPLAAGGSKYMQFQEDGLPTLEFGDLFNVATDVFVRNDFNIAQIETIRGGSASTFASDSPGGLINLISKTGDTEGGSIQVSSGIGFDEKRVDFDYGGPISGNMRFHAGGFYRKGEGPRNIGFDGWRGGQMKLNVTREFENGYIRVYLKYLDDRSPTYAPYPVNITGTDDKPSYKSFAGFDLRTGSVLSPLMGPLITLDENNQLTSLPLETGQHAISKSVGVEAQFDVAGWTITEKMRYAKNSGEFDRAFPNVANSVANFAALHGGAGATAVYANGPNAGQPIPAGSLINGNGLLALYFVSFNRARSLDNFTNDIRASRVWQLPGGKLTTTAGAYFASQRLNSVWLHSAMDIDINGNGETARVDIYNADGQVQTLNGYYAFGRATSLFRRIFDVDYTVIAPYGSINYHFGKIALGASVRYDMGKARGSLYGADLGGGRSGLITYDVNNDGVIVPAESRVAYLPLTEPAPAHYDYAYLSYSGGVNYRIAEPFSVFARYSKGGRSNADKILFTPVVSTTDGSVASSRDKYDAVVQLEGGFKFRKDWITLNATAFRVTADDHNVLNGSANRTDRSYRAHGLELEGTMRKGVFSLAWGATYTKAKITEDRLDPALTGKEPRHQPTWTLSVTPQVDLGRVNFGANAVTITKSYTQDSNKLVMPGFTIVNVFAQVHPVDRVTVSVNVNNLFNTLGIFEVNQSAVPASGIGFARTAPGRTASAALRFDF